MAVRHSKNYNDFRLKPTRRTALRQMAGAATLTAFPILGQDPPPENRHSSHPVTKEAAKEYNFVFFRPEQMETLDALTETIIPTDAHSPGAKAARVSEYIDAIVADSSDATKRVWSDGLQGMDRMATEHFGTSYGRAKGTQQVELLTRVAANEEQPKTAEERFFVVLKRATIDGYYTSRIGIYEDLQYQGNAVLGSYPDCTHGGHNQ